MRITTATLSRESPPPPPPARTGLSTVTLTKLLQTSHWFPKRSLLLGDLVTKATVAHKTLDVRVGSWAPASAWGLWGAGPPISGSSRTCRRRTSPGRRRSLVAVGARMFRGKPFLGLVWRETRTREVNTIWIQLAYTD